MFSSPPPQVYILNSESVGKGQMADDECKSYKNNCLRPLILGVTLPFIRVSNVFKSSCSGAGSGVRGVVDEWPCTYQQV